MKEITINNKKSDLFKAKALSFILVLLVIILFGSEVKNGFAVQKDSYYSNAEVEVVAEAKQNETYTSYIEITTKKDDTDVIFLASCTLDTFNNKVNVGDTIKITYVVSNSYNVVYAIQNGEDKFFDMVDSTKQSGKSIIIFGSVCVALALAYLIWKVVEILRKPLVEKFDYVEYALTPENLITNKMMNKNSPTRKYMTTYNILCAVFAGVVLLSFLMFNSIIALLGDFKVPGLIIFGCVLIACFVLLFVFRPKFNSKQSAQYAIDYFDYLHNGPSFTAFYTPYEFRDLSKTIQTNEEGTEEVRTDEKVLVYSKKGEEVSYDVNKLNLYAVGVYRKNFFGGNIFIVTDRDDLTEKEVDFIIPLTFENYHQIKEMNIEVKGLDYLEEHFQEEIVKNTLNKGKKNVIVKYNGKPLDDTIIND